jgi:uncharacterized membrane protein YkoI
MKRFIAALIGLVIPLALASADGHAQRGNNRGDQDRALEALRNGEVMPLARILPIVAQHLPGAIIDVEFDTERGQLRYEIRVLTPAGEVREIRLDARTGAFISIED